MTCSLAARLYTRVRGKDEPSNMQQPNLFKEGCPGVSCACLSLVVTCACLRLVVRCACLRLVARCACLSLVSASGEAKQAKKQWSIEKYILARSEVLPNLRH